MIRFIFKGEATDQDIPAHSNAIGPAALGIVGAEPDAVFVVRQTSATAWRVNVDGETVTAEEIEE